MRISARPMALFADLWPAGALPWIFSIAVLAAGAAPGAADARKAGAAGYDGIWNVLIIAQAGSCDPAYSYPFRVSGGGISSMGPANVSGSVGRGGAVVRILAGGRTGSGNARLGGSTGAGRWTARVSSGNCSGSWQATRGNRL